VKKRRVTQLGLIVLVGLWARSEDCADRGLNFSHKGHFKQKKMKCTDCHGMKPAQRSMPNHQLCSICHETDEDAEDVLECAFCHTRADNTVDGLAKLLADEVKFGHEPHREKKCSDCHPRGEMLKQRMPDDPSKSNTPQMPTCELCHPDPDTARLAADPAMPFCVGCHQSMGESRSECTICHNTITKKTLSTHRAGVRISHDNLQRWKTEYAEVYRKDPVFCAYCHDEPFEP
jgi:hypothetical protein